MAEGFDRENDQTQRKPDCLLYKTARELAVKVLNRVERSDSYLDRVLDFELKNPELNKVEKSFLTELVNGTVRWKLKLDHVITKYYYGDYSKVDTSVRNAIRVATYQLMFHERIPPSAIVNETVEFVKRLKGQESANQMNAILRLLISKLDHVEYPSIEEDPIKALSIIHSFPPWLVKRFVDRFGMYETEQLLASLNERPRLPIRVNPLTGSADSLAQEFEKNGMIVYHGKFIPNFLYVEGLARISELASFRSGRFVVQDEGAGIVSILLDPKPGDRILDACSAPGTKASHIVELTSRNIELICIEKYEVRARLVEDAFKRLNYEKGKVVVGDSSCYADPVPFDKILVDAPSSAFGLIRRKPDSKWKREPQDIAGVMEIQSSILENTARLLKKDGTIVYSTCTIETGENHGVVEAFLSRHPEFVLEPADKFVDRALVGREGYVEIFPHRHDMDGGFAARLKKIS